jgi:hypothetical protein
MMIIIIIVIILTIRVKFLQYKLKQKLHMLKTYELPEDGQQLRPKHVGALANK